MIRHPSAAWLFALVKVMRHGIYHSSGAREALRSIELVKALPISQGLSK
jgi:hypothetical protein